MGELRLPGESGDARGESWPAITSENAAELSVRGQRAKRKLALAKADGFREALEEFVPGLIERMEQREKVAPRLMEAIAEAVAQKDWKMLASVAPVWKASLDEDKRLLDRLHGTAVQKSQSEVMQTVVHTNLRDLVADSKFVDAVVVEELSDGD